MLMIKVNKKKIRMEFDSDTKLEFITYLTSIGLLTDKKYYPIQSTKQLKIYVYKYIYSNIPLKKLEHTFTKHTFKKKNTKSVKNE